MSDEESYEYEYDSQASEDEAMNSNQDEEESFQYTDDEDEADDVDVALENAYYNAKGHRDAGELEEAHQMFDCVLTMENTQLSKSREEDEEGVRYGSWSYKALKQIVKLELQRTMSSKDDQEYERTKLSYQHLLECLSSPNLEDVSPNAIEKGINAMLERVVLLLQDSSSTASGTKNAACQGLARYVYDSTLNLFNPNMGKCPNERLWFKTNLKYGQLLYEMNETSKLQSVIKDLLKATNSNNDSSTSATSSTNLMEIYALQIQLYSRQKNNKKLRSIFQKACTLQGGIPHPRTLALIQELGGKMHMASREYAQACTSFFSAFKSYDEAGDRARLRCLKYLVMASMLHASSINPFDSQEARSYKDDPEIVAMTNLVDAFHNNEIEKFEKILARNEGNVMGDEFIREYLADLLRTIRLQVLQQVIRPYTKISLDAISKELNGIPVTDVESLLVALILDGKLDGKIDQVKSILIKQVDGGDGKGGSKNHASNSESAEGATSNAMSRNTKTSVSIRTCTAMEGLLSDLEGLVTTVSTFGNNKSSSQLGLVKNG